MTIYKANISDFIKDCSEDIIASKIAVELKNKKGICVGEKEITSWKTTLKSLSKDLVYIIPNNQQYILLEYLVPFTNKRIDVILVGANKYSKNLVIIELKGWSEIGIRQDSKLLYPNVSYGPLSHPAYEALDYQYILENQFDDISSLFKISAIAYLPNYRYKDTNPLLDRRYLDVLGKIKTYCQNNRDDLISLLKEFFTESVETKYVNLLDKLDYKPSKNFIESLKNEFNDIHLIHSQRVAFERIKESITINEHIKKKALFIISGSAGSGKTIVAFKLLNWILTQQKLAYLLLPGIEFRRAVKKTFGKQVGTCNRILGAYARVKADFVIVDEAHKATANGTCQQFYNTLFKNSCNAITLIDDMQVINKKGFTKRQLKDMAEKHGFTIYESNLQEQFRSGGDASYIDWLKNWIFQEKNFQEIFVNNLLEFEVLNGDSFNKMYKEKYDIHNARLISFWTQTWNLEELNEFGLPKATVFIDDEVYIWNPNNEWLSQFKKNNPSAHISNELKNLCETQNFITYKKGFQYIAYFNTVQGSEFDYIFVHIPKLFYLNDKQQIDVDLSQLAIREMKSQIWETNKIKDPLQKLNKINLNKRYFLNRLFIALTRGIKGVYVYADDQKLADYIKSKIQNKLF